MLRMIAKSSKLDLTLVIPSFALMMTMNGLLPGSLMSNLEPTTFVSMSKMLMVKLTTTTNGITKLSVMISVSEVLLPREKELPLDVLKTWRRELWKRPACKTTHPNTCFITTHLKAAFERSIAIAHSLNNLVFLYINLFSITFVKVINHLLFVTFNQVSIMSWPAYVSMTVLVETCIASHCNAWLLGSICLLYKDLPSNQSIHRLRSMTIR